jgi:hypothetical protein
MAENLKELALRLAQNRNSQNTPQRASQQTNKETPQEEEEYSEDEEDNEEEEDNQEVEQVVEEKRPSVKPKRPEIKQEETDHVSQVQMEIELLQNNGRFRVELLHRLDEINRALTIVAGVLVQLAENGAEKSEK